jgi:hypothetical protein
MLPSQIVPLNRRIVSYLWCDRPTSSWPNRAHLRRCRTHSETAKGFIIFLSTCKCSDKCFNLVEAKVLRQLSPRQRLVKEGVDGGLVLAVLLDVEQRALSRDLAKVEVGREAGHGLGLGGDVAQLRVAEGASLGEVLQDGQPGLGA